VRAPAAALLGLTLAAAAPARGGEPPGAPRLAAEVLGSASTSVLYGVGESGYGLRVGLGGTQEGETPWGGTKATTWLVTAAYLWGGHYGGAPVDEARLGVGFRLRSGRLGLGADAELLRASVDRASTSGRLVATGLAVRVVGALDLARLDGRGAVVATLDLGLAELGTGRAPAHEPSISLGLGLRL